MSKPELVGNLKKIATECRMDILKMLEKARSGHPGGSLSAIDIIATLFFHEMHTDPHDPLSDERDRFILSKGHAVPALYAVFAKKGYLPREELWTLRQVGSRLQGHPDRAKLPLVEASTGSLGQGLSIAQGIAMGFKHRNMKNRVYCMIGDGESQEGQIWEAALSAPRFKLNNLVVIMDNNHAQLDGTVEEILDIRPILDKWSAFGWATQTINGHDFRQILDAFERAREEKERPVFIHADTVKGKGVSFMENVVGWHGVAPDREQTEKALAELARELTP